MLPSTSDPTALLYWIFGTPPLWFWAVIGSAIACFVFLAYRHVKTTTRIERTRVMSLPSAEQFASKNTENKPDSVFFSRYDTGMKIYTEQLVEYVERLKGYRAGNQSLFPQLQEMYQDLLKQKAWLETFPECSEIPAPESPVIKHNGNGHSDSTNFFSILGDSLNRQVADVKWSGVVMEMDVLKDDGNTKGISLGNGLIAVPSNGSIGHIKASLGESEKSIPEVSKPIVQTSPSVTPKNQDVPIEEPPEEAITP